MQKKFFFDIFNILGVVRYRSFGPKFEQLRGIFRYLYSVGGRHCIDIQKKLFLHVIEKVIQRCLYVTNNKFRHMVAPF